LLIVPQKMPTLNLQRIVSSLMVLLVHLILLSVSAKGFQNHPVSYPSSMARARRDTTQMSNTNNSSDGDGGDWDDDASLPLPTSKPVTTSSQLEDGTFNPFNYQRNNKSSRSSGGGQVDLRSLRMSSLTNDLLNNLGNEAMMREILEDNRDFLLEPLEVEDSVAVRLMHSL